MQEERRNSFVREVGMLAFLVLRVLSWLRVARPISRLILSTAISRRHPRLFAFFWLLGSEMFSAGGGFQRKKLVALVLSKSGGNEDLLEAFQSDTEVLLMFLDRTPLYMLSRLYFPDRVSESNHFYSDQEVLVGRDLYRSFLKGVVSSLASMCSNPVVVQFNHRYFPEVDFGFVCESFDIPFICHQKEALHFTVTPELLSTEISAKFAKFQGRMITTYNVDAQQVLLRSGIGAEGRVKVVGSPRLDKSHRLRRSAKENGDTPDLARVVFFLIQTNAGMAGTIGAELMERASRRGMDWKRMAEQTNEAIWYSVKSFPDVEFVVKAKTGFAEDQISLFLGGRPCPTNLKVVRGGVGHDFLAGARAVVGFNSTALLEAVAAGVPVISPRFEIPHELEPYVYDFGDSVSWADKPENISDFISQCLEDDLRSQRLHPAQEEVLERYLGNSDGRSSERLRREICGLVLGN